MEPEVREKSERNTEDRGNGTCTVMVWLYIGWSDVTEFTVTLRSPFCGYNTTYALS